MKLSLQDQIVVVVGGAQGIGHAIAKAFSEEGCRVALLDRSDAVLGAAEEMTRNCGVECRAWVVDVTDETAVESCASDINELWGGARHVVYAAGCGSGKFGFPFWNLDPADWPRVLAVNLYGAVHTAHAFQSQLCRSGSGSLLFLTSVAGQIGSQTDPPYSAAKAALTNFMHCAAKDFAPFGVRVNAIAPGMVRTSLNEAVWEASQAGLPVSERQDYAVWAGEKIRRVSPLGRWQEPEEFGAMAVFLASEAARNITGQTLNIDGGQVMHA